MERRLEFREKRKQIVTQRAFEVQHSYPQGTIAKFENGAIEITDAQWDKLFAELAVIEDERKEAVPAA